MSTTTPSSVPAARTEVQRTPRALRFLTSFPASSLALAIVSVLVCSALIAASTFDLSPYFGEQATTVRDIARWRSGEYLFFIGTSYFALLLLRSGKWIWGALVFGFGILWASFYGSAMDFVGNLGSDSIAEAQNFELSEAWFWLQTLRQMIVPYYDWTALAYYSAAATASYLVFRYVLRLKEMTARFYPQIKVAMGALLICAALYQSLSNAVKWFAENTQAYTGVELNFKQKAPLVVAGGKGVDMLIYVGESTAAMNMGIYGYPRDTTPKLQNIKDTDRNLIVFPPLFSTHTHTSPSLMEALSFAVDRSEYYVPIEKRKRLSIVDLFDLQPVEFAKLALTALTAHCLAVGIGWNQGGSNVAQRWLRWLRMGAPVLLFAALLAVALVQVDDFSPLILLLVWGATMAFVFSLVSRTRWASAALAGAALAVCAAIALLRSGGAVDPADWSFYGDRFLVWLEPLRHPHTGQQLLMGAQAIAEGAWLGADSLLGFASLGESAGAALSIPAVQDDFAPSFFLNRHGLAGALLLWALQAAFLAGIFSTAVQAFAASRRARDFRHAWLGRFCCFALCGGAAFVLGHFLLSWGTNLAIFPIMGQPMSFLSAGGSHLLFFICPLLALGAISAQSFEEN